MGAGQRARMYSPPVGQLGRPLGLAGNGNSSTLAHVWPSWQFPPLCAAAEALSQSTRDRKFGDDPVVIRLAVSLFLIQAGFHGFTASIPLALARAGRVD